MRKGAQKVVHFFFFLSVCIQPNSPAHGLRRILNLTRLLVAISFSVIQKGELLFQRGQIFKIDSVDATKDPPLFTLRDLMNEKVRGNYYAAQLKEAPTPGIEFQFEVRLLIQMAFNINFFFSTEMDCFPALLHMDDEVKFLFKCVTLSVVLFLLAISLKFMKVL
jgi:hypothetical protein